MYFEKYSSKRFFLVKKVYKTFIRNSGLPSVKNGISESSILKVFWRFFAFHFFFWNLHFFYRILHRCRKWFRDQSLFPRNLNKKIYLSQKRQKLFKENLMIIISIKNQVFSKDGHIYLVNRISVFFKFNVLLENL